MSDPGIKLIQLERINHIGRYMTKLRITKKISSSKRQFFDSSLFFNKKKTVNTEIARQKMPIVAAPQLVNKGPQSHWHAYL